MSSLLIERNRKTFDEQVEEWREEAPKRFAEFATTWDKGNGYYKGDLHQFAPPTLSNLCQDWRVQGVNRLIARIDSMDGDIVGIRNNDPIWEYVGMEACL